MPTSGDRFEGDLRDVFALQDEITARIVSAVEEKVRDAEIRRARAKPTASLTAYDIYLRALPAWFGQTMADYKTTQVLLGQALDMDPEYAEALGTLTDSVNTRTIQGWHETWSSGAEEALRIADRALASDWSTAPASRAPRSATAYCRTGSRKRLSWRIGHSSCIRILHSCAIGPPRSTSRAARATRRFLNAKRPVHEPTRHQEGRYLYLLHSIMRILPRAPVLGGDSRRKARIGIRPAVEYCPQEFAISLAQLGRTDEARSEIAELLRYQPGASLRAFRQQPFRHKWMHELHIEGLRKAGLREE